MEESGSMLGAVNLESRSSTDMLLVEPQPALRLQSGLCLHPDKYKELWILNLNMYIYIYIYI